MTRPREPNARVVELLARIATLEQLLEVYERSVIEQSDKLYAEQDRIRFQKTLLECQGDASIDGLLSVSGDGVILFANQRLAEMWRVPPPRVGTKGYEALLASMAQQTTDPEAFLARSAELSEVAETREEVSLRDGRTFDRYTAPIRSREGESFGRLWHFRDITRFKELNRAKDEFISAVSHELRTPLTSIRGSLDLMLGGVAGPLPDEARTLAEIAQVNCQRLMRILNDVLDVERIETGHLELDLQPHALAPLVERCLESMRPYGERFGVRFSLANSVAAARVRVDPDRLAQVLENLLSNAAKFSPPCGRVEVSLARSGASLRVSVRDRGPGIPPEFRSRVFEKFAQGPSPQGRPGEGTGLGLSICRAIVERLGGSLGFESQPGAGTTFFFELPEWSPAPGGAPG